MAVTSACEKLMAGLDLACTTLLRKYYQQAVIINKDDIDTFTINTSNDPSCAYNVEFTLKEGTTGYLIKGNESGNVFKGMYNKTRNDTSGQPEYIHQVQMLVAGVSEETKCALSSLDNGNYVVVLQAGDKVEVYGIRYGLTTDDYTYDIVETGGGVSLILTSLENAPEDKQPLIYVSDTPGNEVTDFDDLFANPAPSV